MTHADIPAVVRLHERMIQSWGATLGGMYLDTLYSRIVESPHRGCGLVCYEGNRLVGLIMGTSDAPWYTGNGIYLACPVLPFLVLIHIIRGSFSVASLLGHRTTQHALAGLYRSPYMAIQSICTDTAYQGQGIGKKLIESMRTYCTSHALTTLYVDTLLDNTVSQKFYRAVGFRKLREIGDSVMYEMKI